MRRQTVYQPSLMGFAVDDFESHFPETSGGYQPPRYYEAAARPAPEAISPALEHSHPIQEAAVLVLLNLIRAGQSLSCSSSWGKDSTCCVFLLVEAVRRAANEGISIPHFITTSSTGVENPAMEAHSLRCQDEVRAHCQEHDLPIEVHTVYPSLASSFVVTTIGRGTLPRVPENGKARQCSADWKSAPQERLVKQLNGRVLSASCREIVTIVGTRLDESATRAKRMTARGDSATTPVRNKDNHLVLSLIAHWKLNDVWNTIEMLADPGTSPYVPPISQESVERLFTLYRDANDGVCGVTLGDGGNMKVCGSRFGCHCCTVSGDKDKSMESMLVDSRYSYMQPLNDFRNLLMSAQNDFDMRELLGRSVSEAGYIGIQPDVYSYSFRRQLLWYLLSMDANERDRAEQMEADIASGRVEDTPDNRMLSSPMFENVSLTQLALVDWHWGMNYQADHAFPALSIWYEVNHLGRRALPPKRLKAPKLTLPTKRWFKIGNCDHDGIPSEGLRSVENELWNRNRHPERAFTHRVAHGEKTVWFDEDDNLTVDPVEACTFITCTFPQMAIEVRHMPAMESTRWWLNEGIIKLPDGQAYRYQDIAKRNQYIYNLAAKLDLSPSEMNRYLMTHSISNAEHNKLIAVPSSSEAEPTQPDLFSLPLAA